MACATLTRPQSVAHVDLDRYSRLPFQAKSLIEGWFQRARTANMAAGGGPFEAFIYAWFSINAWAACVTDQDHDRQFVNALSFDHQLCQRFATLMTDDNGTFPTCARGFAEHWPIFEVKELRKKGISRFDMDPREDVNEYILRHRVMKYAPGCWKHHWDAGESVPIDWPHTLQAIYRVRCNLFHGDKGYEIEGDREVVSIAFRLLMHFFEGPILSPGA